MATSGPHPTPTPPHLVGTRGDHGHDRHRRAVLPRRRLARRRVRVRAQPRRRRHHEPGRRRRPPRPSSAPTTAGGRPRRPRRARPWHAAAPTTTPETFPPADPAASNFLLTGADNGACVDPDSPYAPAFGDEESGRVGERSDTIMIMRVDPAAKRVAVLSFPRDLYVTIADTGNRARINTAYRRNEPQTSDRHDLRELRDRHRPLHPGRLLHVQDARRRRRRGHRAVRVPRRVTPTSGLNVLEPGCFTFDGDHALAYVRSRKYEYEDPPGSGKWQEDPTSDLGRVSRQQDFLRRSLTSILNKGLLNPSVASGLINTATGGDVVTSSELSLAKLMEFAGVRARRARRRRSPRTRSRRRADHRRRRPCSSRGSRATTCRPCWRCSAASRRSPTPPCSRSSRRRRPSPDPADPRQHGRHDGTGDDGAGHRTRGEQRRRRPAAGRPVPLTRPPGLPTFA